MGHAGAFLSKFDHFQSWKKHQGGTKGNLENWNFSFDAKCLRNAWNVEIWCYLEKKKKFWGNLTSGNLEIVGNRNFFLMPNVLKTHETSRSGVIWKKKIIKKIGLQRLRNFLNCRKSNFFFFDARRLENAWNVEIWCISKTFFQDWKWSNFDRKAAALTHVRFSSNFA